MNFEINKQAFEEGFNKVAVPTPGGSMPGGDITPADPNQPGMMHRFGNRVIDRAYNLPSGSAEKLWSFAPIIQKNPALLGQVSSFIQKHPEAPNELAGMAAGHPDALENGYKALHWFNHSDFKNLLTGGGGGRLAAAGSMALRHPWATGALALGTGAGVYGLINHLFGGQHPQSPNININVGQPAGTSIVAKSARPFQNRGAQSPEMDTGEMQTTAADTSLPAIADKVVSAMIEPEPQPEQKLHLSIVGKGVKAKKMLKNPNIKAYIRNMVENADRQADAVKGNL